MLHLPTLRAKRQIEDDLDRRLAAQAPAHPREAAIAYIQGQIDDRLAGLDCYDPTVLVLDAAPFERVWANRALELTGIVLDSRMWAGAIRYRAVVEADVRGLLGLDLPDAPTMVEPLASRSIHSVPDLAEAARDLVAPSTRQISVGEPVSAAALRAAKDAYDRRTSTLTVDATCPACHGTGGGTYNDCATCDGNGVV